MDWSNLATDGNEQTTMLLNDFIRNCFWSFHTGGGVLTWKICSTESSLIIFLLNPSHHLMVWKIKVITTTKTGTRSQDVKCQQEPPTLDADALNVKRTRRYVLGSKSWWWTTMHTTGTHVAAKARKKPPMSNAQSLREKLQFGQINNVLCNKCKMLNKWEWIFVWSGCRQVEHQRSLSPLSANRSK